jgi:hypothetical protein
MLRFSEWSLNFRLSNHNFIHISHLSHELPHVADVFQNKVYGELEGIFQGSDRLHIKRDQIIIAYM